MHGVEQEGGLVSVRIQQPPDDAVCPVHGSEERITRLQAATNVILFLKISCPRCPRRAALYNNASEDKV